ncbi:Succinate dehydrogenase flavoprotein subunit [Candidatus Paraburkholderia calva]|nr:Succinate dehydrogenase flavoprotein subunit [Candidatus Paraburkholderia calva]
MAVDPAAFVRAVQAEVLPTQRNWTRHADLLEDSLSRLDALWRQVRVAAASEKKKEVVRAREAVAMLAVPRWMYRSALARTETCGMSWRADHSAADPAQRQRLLSGWLDEVWVTRHAMGNEIRKDLAA